MTGGGFEYSVLYFSYSFHVDDDLTHRDTVGSGYEACVKFVVTVIKLSSGGTYTALRTSKIFFYCKPGAISQLIHTFSHNTSSLHLSLEQAQASPTPIHPLPHPTFSNPLPLLSQTNPQHPPLPPPKNGLHILQKRRPTPSPLPPPGPPKIPTPSGLQRSHLHNRTADGRLTRVDGRETCERSTAHNGTANGRLTRMDGRETCECSTGGEAGGADAGGGAEECGAGEAVEGDEEWEGA